MGRDHVSHSDINQFAANKVNLPRDKANVYRAQARRLREKLDSYLSEHPEFSLKKMIISGSLAKGTALRSLNDIDIGCYISGADAPREINELLDYLAQRLREAFPNFSADQVQPQTYSVKVSFRGSGLDVDVVPILYGGDPDWYGNLVSQNDGSLLKTSIPLHIEFFRKRKDEHGTHYPQVIRLVKSWIRYMKNERSGFKFKSFMAEMFLAKLADEGKDFSDYPEALQHFFTYIVTSGMREQIAFTDYYPASKIGSFSDPIQIIDPVNAKNNAAKHYTKSKADIIIEAALEAGDAIDAALAAPTKGKTIYYWQKVFGPSFQI